MAVSRDLISRVATASPEEKQHSQKSENCPFPSGEGGPTGRMRSFREAQP